MVCYHQHKDEDAKKIGKETQILIINHLQHRREQNQNMTIPWFGISERGFTTQTWNLKFWICHGIAVCSKKHRDQRKWVAKETENGTVEFDLKSEKEGCERGKWNWERSKWGSIWWRKNRKEWDYLRTTRWQLLSLLSALFLLLPCAAPHTPSFPTQI